MANAAVKGVMFVWEGTDKAGKKLKGEMSGTSDSLIKAVLRRHVVERCIYGVDLDPLAVELCTGVCTFFMSE